MKTILLQEFIESIGGYFVSGHSNPSVKHVNRKYDSTNWKDHTMFFHLHDYRDIVIHPGLKSIVIVTRRPEKIKNLGSQVTIVKVQSVRRAYWRFIHYYRGLFSIPFISVTGTCGKTTTKEMISWILKHDRNVNKTSRSLNATAMNLHYLLNVDDQTDVTVIEAAVASIGHMKASCHYFRPQIGVLTSIGVDHLNGFPSFQSYMQEKAKIFDCVGNKGTVVVNGDDVNIQKLDLTKYKGTIIWYGKTPKAEFRIIGIKYETNGMKFILSHNRKQFKLFVPGYGEHNVYNAVAAIAVSYKLGVSIEESGRRLKTFQHIERHSEVKKGINGSILIDDTWSTNPTSIKSALDVLTNISKGKKKIAVIGDIKWLADQSRNVHLSVGDMVAKSGIQSLITIGKDARLIGKRAVELGFDRKRVYMFESPIEAQKILPRLVDKDSVVLVKTSMKQSFGVFMESLKA
ncbi:Mur ligase family protein [Bacillus suaedaesalsae]|uniref:UDP-N-acetylmuramoyl-tripeptide--D-alanyl-D-alanine ligase n=1 Tax=Bacillus suaedaesalsae TaxID=2810349 RepID=A0ABS2DI84_9BACI|nr:UDP-N-acetylmuramoyl-tripeptide--D-alanyl-D-alanine ligase [Bacillus suaedaesalsae]MBM6618212.1 UDP-N-acetylmuramoyl-tripeptide--D-alanyl-D-alanine ligase [Bacillus suaedaesalsae]